jgi:hypothetical protein
MNSEKTIVFLIFSIALGILFGFGNVFIIILVSIIIGVIFLISLILFFIGLAINKQKLHSYSAKILGLSIILIVSTLITSSVRKDSKEKYAQKIIVDLKKYKSVNGFYPDSLPLIGYDNKTFIYNHAENKEEFKIRYIIDGWHKNKYSSKTDRWQGGD